MQRGLLGGAQVSPLGRTDAWPEAGPTEKHADQSGHEHTTAARAGGRAAARPARTLGPAALDLIGSPMRGAMAVLPAGGCTWGRTPSRTATPSSRRNSAKSLTGASPAREGGPGPFGEVTIPPPGETALNGRLAQHIAICGTCAPVIQYARRVEAWGQTGHLALLGLAAAAAPRHAQLAQRLALLSLAILAISRGAAALAGRLQVSPSAR